MKTLLFVLLLLLSLPLGAARHHLLIISGIGGLDEYAQQFTRQAEAMRDAAIDAGLARENIIMLSASAAQDPARAQRLSDRDGIEQAIDEIAAAAAAEDSVFVLLIGHGNPRGETSVFNIPGPDISAADLGALLQDLAPRRLVIVNAASASGPFIDALSGRDRVVITATSNGREYHATLFGEYFVAAFAGSGADRDKDEKISMLEAFEFARSEVRRAYQGEKRLLTEHALLDDNGDGVGSLEPGEFENDGGLASRVFLQPPPSFSGTGAGELAALLEQKQALEESIRQLKMRRDSLAKTEYYEQLELLLVDLALLSRQIRSRAGS